MSPVETAKRQQRFIDVEIAKREARKLKRSLLPKAENVAGQPTQSRPVRDTKTGVIYPSVNAAAKALGWDNSHLRQVLRGLYTNNTGLELVSTAAFFDPGI